MIKSLFGNSIRQYRNALGISQESFAKKIGLDRTYISDVEQGKRNISIENIDKIATGLDIPISFLFNDSFTKDNILLSVRGIIFLLQSRKQLTNSEKEKVNIFCRALFDDYTECQEMDTSTLLSFIKTTLANKYKIELVSIPISTKLDIC